MDGIIEGTNTVENDRYMPLPIDDLKEYGKYERNRKPSAPLVPKGFYVRRRSMKGNGPTQLTFVSEESPTKKR